MKKLVVLAALMALAAGTAQANLRVYGSYLDAGDLEEAYGAGAGVRLEFLPFLGLDLRGSYREFDQGLGLVTGK